MTKESAKLQELGPRKYKQMMEKGHKAAMNNPNIPFKPIPKPKIVGGGSKLIECEKCGAVLQGTKFTYMIICNNCSTITRVDSSYA